ncbi:transcriptional regulator [Acrocarpospora pleiomorpha]|uniref:Transcriptional regulator n=1 Tax=Acrocarpospora pleiomorpha TaxID=90975 RepID=A0A5M3XIY6_9ACTN|nr:IclR family transcriptional regulator [Acrocarpospora pleiomorpha]GES20722.1 transcriptional regulator [Acrocarpospora pleiomorpha]
MATQILTSSLKTLEVLAALADCDTGVGVSELARRLGGSRGYVHRQLVTLAAGNWVEQSEDGTYRLSLRVARLSAAALRQAGLDQRASAAMEELAAALHEPVSLAVLDGDAARIIHRIDVNRSLRVDTRVESRMPMSKSASGRVLTAFESPLVLERLAGLGVELPPAEDLAAIREAGYAHSVAGFQDETVAIAAPVFDPAGHVIAAVSIVGPVSRFAPDAAVEPLLACAARVNAIVSGTSFAPPSQEGR